MVSGPFVEDPCPNRRAALNRRSCSRLRDVSTPPRRNRILRVFVRDPIPDDTMTNRRTFLTRTGGCLAQLAVLDAMGWMGPGLFAADRSDRIVQEVPWGRLEDVAEGVWA